MSIAPMLKLFMKSLIPIVMLIALFAACKNNPAQQYGDNLIDAKERAEKAADDANLSIALKSIDTFRAANGRNPESLKELSEFMRVALDSEKYDYDPSTGRISRR